MKNIEIKLPKIGESTTEAKIVEWLKQPGDTVKKDEVFAVIGTDKVDSDLFSEYHGVLTQHLAQVGDEVLIGAAIALMDVDDATIVHDAIKEAKTEAKTEALNKPQAHQTSPKLDIPQDAGLYFVSPLVRKMAAENALSIEDLKKIKTTGDNNRIRKQDIELYLKPKKQAKTTFEDQKLELNIEAGDKVEPLSKMRKLIADNMNTAWRNIPHVTTFCDVNMTKLVAHRTKVKNKYLQEHGVKVTFTHFIMKNVVEALQLYPKFNAWFNGEEGFATALPDGNLIVPNIKISQSLEVQDLANQVAEISGRARINKLKPDDIQNTTFTVSNTGIFGSKMGTPIIARPQVAVLALGAILRAPAVITQNGEETLVIQDMMALSISYDHRVIDGALASKFLMELKTRLENY
jgi:2-oxoglutarate dehydrogenase E2 component (dihydrolipoamide succinyltransferase)